MDRGHERPMSTIRRKLRGVEHPQCPIYEAPTLGSDSPAIGLTAGIVSRPDIDYARQVIGANPSPMEVQAWSEDGICKVPTATLYVSLLTIFKYVPV